MVPALAIENLAQSYESGGMTPTLLVKDILEVVSRHHDRNIWISLVPTDELLKRAALIEERWGNLSPEERSVKAPLYGVPFAVKDNIDVAGMETTAGCPEFAYVPENHATVVELLLQAGAMLVGKTNMDQFATGLVGTRSPYGECENALDPEYIAGGSSSGSAVGVALSMVSFSLGTDTAGSGRVPAAFNGIVGLKPSLGLISCAGVVPACRSIDCVSIFAQSVKDAAHVLNLVAQSDLADPYSRVRPSMWTTWDGSEFTFGVPSDLDCMGNDEYARCFDEAVQTLISLGGRRVEIDYDPFAKAADLLYGGPWVAERYAAVGPFIESTEGGIDPVVKEIILGGKKFSAVEFFECEYRRKDLSKKVAKAFEKINLLLMPTASTHYKRSEIAEAPIQNNTNLGKYTNFVNMMDLSAVAVPAGKTSKGMPFGVTMAAPAFRDMFLCSLSHAFQGMDTSNEKLSVSPMMIEDLEESSEGLINLAVVGAHLSGLPLNHELTNRGARLVRACTTAPNYKLFSLPGTVPRKPGLLRVEDKGHSIEVEVWTLPASEFGSFVAGVPAPLGIGSLELDTGEIVKGFICEPYALEGAIDISNYGGFKPYLTELGV